MRLLALLLIIAFISGCVEKPENNESIPLYPQVVDLAKKDLAQRLNISVEQIKFVRQEKVDWNDTGLGYPEEGMFYAQVITPGFRIILKAENRLYEYHSDYTRVVGPKEV